MADINKDDLLAMLKEALGGGPSVDPKSARTLKELVEQYEKLTKQVKQSGNSYSILNKVLGQNTTVARQVAEDLAQLDAAIEETVDAADIAVLKQKRRDLELAAQHATQKQMLYQFGQSMAKVGSTAFAGAGQFIKGLQSGGSGIELASGLMTAGLDMAGQTSQALGTAAGSVGQVLMNHTNPRVKALGSIAAVAGPLIGQLGESATKLAKFGVEILAKEVEKTVKAFHTATSSGAMFADGMTGLRNAANAAGLTVDQFAGVLSKHSLDLAAVGMGVTEGAKRVGGALNAGGPQMKASLQKLGYGFEEQAGLVAETMKDMRGSGGPLRASNAEVAAQTQRYAENLRTISAITGEDAKKKMDQVRQQANQLAFQQKLAGMDETQRKGVINAMANMSEIERKNFMDMVNFGSVVNKEGAAAGALSEGLTNSVNGYYQAFQAGTLSEIEARKIQAANSEQVKKDMLDNTGVALAGAAGVGGLVQGISESMGKELEFRNAWTPQAIAAAESAVEGQKNAGDTLTESVVGAEQAAQNLKLALENELTPAIGKFAEVAKEMLSSVQKMIKDVGLHEGGKAGQSQDSQNWEKMKWYEKLESGAARTVETAGEVVSGLSFGLSDKLLGFLGGKSVADTKQERIDNETKYLEKRALGGPIKSGVPYLVGENGPEIVWPESAGRVLPNPADMVSKGTENSISSSFSGISSMLSSLPSPFSSIEGILNNVTGGTTQTSTSSSANESIMADLKQTLEDLTSTAKAQLDKHDEIVRQLADGNSISERLLNNSY
jgi:hypothetical protein